MMTPPSLRDRAPAPKHRLALTLIGLLAFAPLSVAPSSAPLAAGCQGQDRAVVVNFKSRFDTAEVDHTQGKRAIQRMFVRTNGEATRSHGHSSMAVGLTRTQSEFSFKTSTQIYRRGDGMYCVYLRTVEAHLNQIDTVVYVSRDFPKDSCAYNVTYAHEKKHVGIYYFTQKDFAPRIEAALRRLVANANPRVVRSHEAARGVHSALINDGLAGILAELEAERARRNAVLDSEENYAREQAKCSSW